MSLLVVGFELEEPNFIRLASKEDFGHLGAKRIFLSESYFWYLNQNIQNKHIFRSNIVVSSGISLINFLWKNFESKFEINLNIFEIAISPNNDINNLKKLKLNDQLIIEMTSSRELCWILLNKSNSILLIFKNTIDGQKDFVKFMI